MAAPVLTAERLREVLHYDPETGVFTWLVSLKRGTKGKVASCVGKHGYIVIRIDRVLYLAHRLAWLYVTGRWPVDQLDHRNLSRSDNRWENLREATNGENMRNTRAHRDSRNGRKGVFLDRRVGLWVARIMVDRKVHYLGEYVTVDAAASAYEAAAHRLHGEFARTD